MVYVRPGGRISQKEHGMEFKETPTDVIREIRIKYDGKSYRKSGHGWEVFISDPATHTTLWASVNDFELMTRLEMKLGPEEAEAWLIKIRISLALVALKDSASKVKEILDMKPDPDCEQALKELETIITGFETKLK